MPWCYFYNNNIINFPLKLTDEILKDILFNAIFLWALFMVCYSVPKRGIFFYIQDILQNTLSDYENVKLLFIYLLRKYLKTFNKFK